MTTKNEMATQILADLFRFGQFNATVNVQAVGVGNEWANEMRVSVDGSIVGYFGNDGWDRDLYKSLECIGVLKRGSIYPVEYTDCQIFGATS